MSRSYRKCSLKGERPALVMAHYRRRALTTTFHSQPGSLVDDPQHVQDCWRTNQRRLSRRRKIVGRTGTFHFRRPQRRNGMPGNRLGILFSNSVQEAMDLALIAQAATLESRVPILHAFDGSAHRMS